MIGNRLGDGKAQNTIRIKKGGQVFLFLLFGSKKQQFLSAERYGAQLLGNTRIHLPEFFKHQCLFEKPEAGTTVFFGNEKPDQVQFTRFF